jgi:hypothetical protein
MHHQFDAKFHHKKQNPANNSVDLMQVPVKNPGSRNRSSQSHIDVPETFATPDRTRLSPSIETTIHKHIYHHLLPLPQVADVHHHYMLHEHGHQYPELPNPNYQRNDGLNHSFPRPSTSQHRDTCIAVGKTPLNVPFAI